jgi:hypothetical protein
MTMLKAEISMSLDGYVAGPNQSVKDPLGVGGEALHTWAFATRTFRQIHGMEGGATGPDEMEGGTTFHFVTDGIQAALDRARDAAGGKDIKLGGGAAAIQQYLHAGLIDELNIHVAPVLLGDGARLFDNTGGHQTEYECTRVVSSPAVTHYQYRRRRA